MKRRTKIAIVVATLIAVGLTQPATAASLDLQVPNSDAGETNALFDGTTKSLALVIPVPFENRIDSENAVEITVDDLSVNEVVSVSSTNARLVTKLHSDVDSVRATDGVLSLNLRSLGGGPLTFFAFTTSTSHGSFTVTTESASFTRFLVGTPGPAYNISLDTPSFIDQKGSAPLALAVSDVFGNSLASPAQFNPQTNLQVVAVGASVSAFTYAQDSKTYDASLTPRVKDGSITLSVGISANAVAGLSEPKPLIVRTIKVADLDSSIQALRSELALYKSKEKQARQAHNKLARKWNKLGGKQVKLIKKQSISWSSSANVGHTGD